MKGLSKGLCQNCGLEFSGNYCSACGQRSIGNQRLNFKNLVKDFFDNVFNLHSGFFFTFWRLIVAPGQVGRDYVRGRRKSYTHPVRYLIIAIAVQALVDYWFLHPELNEQPDFFFFPFLSADMNQNMAIWNHVIATKYPLIHNTSMILIFPLVFIWLFKPLQYNFTELLTVNFYYFGTGLIITLSGILFFTLFGPGLPVPLIILLTMSYVVWSSMRFFSSVSTLRRIVNILLAIVFFMVFRVFLLVYIVSLFFPR